MAVMGCEIGQVFSFVTIYFGHVISYNMKNKRKVALHWSLSKFLQHIVLENDRMLKKMGTKPYIPNCDFSLNLEEKIRENKSLRLFNQRDIITIIISRWFNQVL